ncbi:MAG: alginate export family protein [Saprospiraceae bacterium]
MRTKTLQNFSALLVFLLMTSVAYSQFELSGEIRPRTEYRHGFKKLFGEGQDPAFFTEQRSRLYADYKMDKMTFKLSIQDIRIWGADRQIYKPGESLNGMNVNQAWAQYTFDSGLGLRVGRQELDYDNARFLGDLSWAQQSRSHDALLLAYTKNTFTGHAGFAFNQNANTAEPTKLLNNYYGLGGANYKAMQYLWLNKKFSKGSVSALIFNDGKEAADSSVNYMQTLGLYGKFSLGKVQLETEAYVQTGKDVTKKDVSAYLLAFNAMYPVSKKVSFGVGMDYVSGTDVTKAATESNSFDPLYGTNHKFYGFMDYFYVGNPSALKGRNVGLVDPYVKLVLNPNPNNNIVAFVHSFRSPVDIYKGGDATTPSMSKALGTELDLVYTIKLSQGVSINLGYSQLFGTDSMAALKGGSKDQTNNWAWTMITFKPSFFKTEKPAPPVQ